MSGPDPETGTGSPTPADADLASEVAPDAAPDDRAATGSEPAGEANGGPGPGSPVAVDEAGVVEADIDGLAVVSRERDDYLDALRRLQADFENYKKRVVKQQSEHLERAAASLVDKLLPVLDTADMAVSHGAGDETRQVRAALLDALAREGLERLDPDGGPFDPTLHDAVAHEPGDGDQEVAEVLRAGYRWKGRVLRPAMVKVRG